MWLFLIDLFPRYLISQGADKEALTDEGEKAEDLVDPDDYKTMAVLLNTEESKEKDRRMSAVRGVKREPAWFRRESMQGEGGLGGGNITLLIGITVNISLGSLFAGCLD